MRWIPTLAVVLLLGMVAPLWRWSTGWGWVPAGMVAVTGVTIVLFTLTVEAA